MSFYGHEYFLSTDDLNNQNKIDQPLQHTSSEINVIEYEKNEPPPAKQSKRPVRKEDYQQYKYVLPTAKTVSDYKHLQASQREYEAAVALNSKPENVKVTLHFDTTSRNSIDGEWPSLILNFSNGQKFRLRPIFFAFEDRNQITKSG